MIPMGPAQWRRYGWGSATHAAALIIVLLLLPGVTVSAPAAAAAARAPKTELDLQSFLDRAADYCDKLSRSVLNFVCRERIEEWCYSDYGRRSAEDGSLVFIGVAKTSKYTYDYQLVRSSEGSIRETRTLLQDDGREVRVPDAPLKTKTFTYAYVVMGPLGLLSRRSQGDNVYRLVKDDKVGGEPAVVIEVVPKPGVRLEHLFGTVWLRKADAQVLKIEWNPSTIQNYQGVEDMARSMQMKPGLVMTSEYAFEKNGIRFPSRYTIKEIYTRPVRRQFLRSQTEVAYDRYQFFTVETEVKF